VSTANRLTIETTSAAKTRALGRELARLLRPRDVLLLQGPLGAGKTALTQGIGQGLGFPSEVTSPTFILLASHPAAGDGDRAGSRDRGLPLYHADLYRLTDPLEVADLHLEEQAADGVLVVEWPERALDELPAEHLLVVIEHTPGAPNGRRLTLVAAGLRYQQLIDGLRARR
jgi:tRNA threonylcarbamoyladenosine biosynthesis protein TsaE